MNERENPPAFPGAGMLGMSLRDWFAGLAMQGELASQHADKEWVRYELKHLAEFSYEIADAMLAERARK